MVYGDVLPTLNYLIIRLPVEKQGTRSFNGACDRCYIPGVAGGPDEVQRPWCPLDVLQSPTYKEPWLRPNPGE